MCCFVSVLSGWTRGHFALASRCARAPVVPVRAPVDTGEMACLGRRRYDPRYDDPYWRRPVGGSCLRDACLLDAGCCLGESLSGNCLVMTLLALPQLMTAMLGTVRARHQHDTLPGSLLTALLIAGIRTTNERSALAGLRVAISALPVRTTLRRR